MPPEKAYHEDLIVVPQKVTPIRVPLHPKAKQAI